MIHSIISVLAIVIGWIVSFLPSGPDIPASAGELLNRAVGFFKSLDQLINVPFELAVITSIIAWQVGRGAFKGIEWAYKRIKG